MRPGEKPTDELQLEGLDSENLNGYDFLRVIVR